MNPPNDVPESLVWPALRLALYLLIAGLIAWVLSLLGDGSSNFQ